MRNLLLLSRLIEEDKEHTENARYILAVMLERKKLLKETDKQQTPNGILRIYEHRKSGEVYIVLDPNIPLDQIEDVQKEVSELLDGKKENPEDAEKENKPEGTEEGSTEEEVNTDTEEGGDKEVEEKERSDTSPDDKDQPEKIPNSEEESSD